MMSGRLRVVLVVAVASFLFLPLAASAQSAFSGVVRDTSGGVLPGVTVEASSPVLIEKTRSVVTDGEGRYTIVDLRPGTYRMAFLLTGFATVVRDGIELPGNTTVPINVDLKVGSIEESVTVSGESPLVDVQNAQRTHVLERSVLDALPTTRNMQTVGAPIPGVKLSRPDVGGSQGMEQAYMRTHGADDRHTSMQVDGMIVNSSMGDGNIQAYNDDALAQQVVFQTSALPAEVAAGGVRVNMIPKDGGNTFKGGGFFGGTAHGWQSDNNDDALRARGFLYRVERSCDTGILSTTTTMRSGREDSCIATSFNTCRTSTSTWADRSYATSPGSSARRVTCRSTKASPTRTTRCRTRRSRWAIPRFRVSSYAMCSRASRIR